MTLGMANPQPADSSVYEVATIKPADPNIRFKGVMISRVDNRLTVTGMTLKYLIQFAYGHESALPPDLVVGEPGWCDQLAFDIVAKPEGDSIPSREQHRQMMRALLADRFKLAIHKEMKETSVLALVIDKNRPKLKAHQPEDVHEHPGIGPSGSKTQRHVTCTVTSMASFASYLEANVLARPVLDRTGLPGTFDFELSWAKDDNQADLPDVYDALKDQLGLKLESTKARVEVVVVDGAAKPTEN